MTKSSCRIDRWLWSVRIFRTRSLAKEACLRGAIRVIDAVVKPSSNLKSGDRVTVKTSSVLKVLEVVQTLEKRVGPAVALDYYLDHTPAPTCIEQPNAVTPVAKRERGSGRPTKRERRQIDKLRRS